MKILSKIKRTLIILILIILTFVLQNTFSVCLRNMTVSPNLLIVFTCIFGYMNGSKEGMYVGFVSGMLVDIFAADILGMNALLFVFVGYFSGIFNRLFYKDMVLLPMILVAFCDLTYNLGFYVLRFALRNKLDFSYYFEKIILPEIVFTTFAALIIYKLLYFINDNWLYKEQRSTLNFD